MADDLEPWQIEDTYKSLPQLTERERNILIAHGVTPNAQSPAFPVKAAFVVFTGPHSFEFEKPPGTAPIGTRVFMFLVRNCDDWPEDLVAFDPGTGRLATWLAEAQYIGKPIHKIHSVPLPVWRSPLSWLRNQQDGIVVIDPDNAAFAIVEHFCWGWEGQCAVEDVQLARSLRRRLAKYLPRLEVRQREMTP